jgi:ATPase involved in DNA repair
MSDFNLHIPITKVDMQKREVWGRATQEIIDGHDEIMDYVSSKPRFQAWSEAVYKRSKGKSKGNVREMHQPIAAGKLIAIDFSDNEKAVDVGVYVSDDSSFRKVCDGTLTGFSIGGDYAKRWMDMGKTRYTADPHEISLVDAPAVSTATFELIKLDGSREMKKFANAIVIEVLKAEGEVAPLTDDVQKFDNIDAQIDKLAPQMVKPSIPDTFPNGEVEIEEGVTEGALNDEDKAYQEVQTDAVIKEIKPGETTGVVETHLQDGEEIKHLSDAAVDEADIERDAPVHDEEAEEEAEHGDKDFSKAQDIQSLLKQIGEKYAAIEKQALPAVLPEVEKVERPTNEVPDWVTKFQEVAQTFSHSVETLDKLKKQEEVRLSKVVAELKQRGSRVGIARRESEPLEPPKDYPADWMQYADPANWSFPMTKNVAGQNVVSYNKGMGREKYSPTEWMVLGRRITRMASDTFGVPYRFSPTDKQVEPSQKMEKTMTGQLLNKQGDPMGLLRDVSKQLSEASAMIASDPSAAKDMLMHVLGMMDVASSISAANPASNTPPDLTDMAKSADKCSKCGGMVAKGDAFCPGCGAELAKVAKSDTPAAPSSEAELAKEDDVNDMEKAEIEKAAIEKYKDEQAALAKAEAEKAAELEKTQTLEDLVKQQGEALIKMQATLEAVAKGQTPIMPPAGDLSAIVQMQENDNPLLKAMNEGNLAKAFETVGNDPVKLYEQVNSLAVQQLALTGINVSRFGFYPAFQVEVPDEDQAK